MAVSLRFGVIGVVRAVRRMMVLEVAAMVDEIGQYEEAAEVSWQKWLSPIK